jgi:hypothetical protein
MEESLGASDTIHADPQAEGWPVPRTGAIDEKLALGSSMSRWVTCPGLKPQDLAAVVLLGALFAGQRAQLRLPSASFTGHRSTQRCLCD